MFDAARAMIADRAWPWTKGFQRQLRLTRAVPFAGSHVLFGSDYSGEQPNSRYRVYGFIVADADASPDWPSQCREVRKAFLSDGRRMAFKNLNDGQRRRALVPFLEAAETFTGHVVTVAVNKELARLSTGVTSHELWARLHGLQARWDSRSFERMARIAHFFSLFVSAWASAGANVSWITDDDSIAANAGRLDDLHQFAARLAGLYLPHQLGEFMLNTVAVDDSSRSFEDFLAIPDLAAGMVSEVMSLSEREVTPDGLRCVAPAGLSKKGDIIADWFGHSEGTLKKTCILIDRLGHGASGVGRLHIATPSN